MIPPWLICVTNWTMEYQSYLMAEYHSHKYNTMLECVSKNAQASPGDYNNEDVYQLYNVKETVLNKVNDC